MDGESLPKYLACFPWEDRTDSALGLHLPH